jgi:hypothetical protein
MIICSCFQNNLDNQFENKILKKSLIDAKRAGRELILFVNLPGVNPRASVCILEPYRDYVDINFPNAVEINRQLKTAGFTPDENYWALIQFESGRKIQITTLPRNQIELMESNSQLAAGGVCGSAQGFVLSFPVHNKILFNVKEEE